MSVSASDVQRNESDISQGLRLKRAEFTRPKAARELDEQERLRGVSREVTVELASGDAVPF